MQIGEHDKIYYFKFIQIGAYALGVYNLHRNFSASFIYFYHTSQRHRILSMLIEI